MSVRKILVAVDNSEEANYAFNWYCDNIRRPEDHVILVHATEVPMIRTMPGHPVNYKDLHDQAAEDTKHIVEKYTALMKAKNVKGEIKSGHAKAGEFICHVAKEDHVLILVIGTRGMGTIRKTIFGSVSDYVIHHAHCPVMVCRK